MIPFLRPVLRTARRPRMLALAALWLAGGVPAAAAAPAPGTPRAQAEAFFAELEAGRTDQAFSVLFEPSPVTRTNTLYPAERRSDLTSFTQSYGQIVGTELVHQAHYGLSVVRLVYLLKLRDFPVTCELDFYRAEGAWVLVRLEFNDQFEGLP